MKTPGAMSLSGLFLSLAVSGGALLPPCAARAFPPDAASEDPFIFRAEVREWLTSGSIRYRASAATPSGMWIPPTDTVHMGSTLDYRDMDSAFPVFSAEVRPLKWTAVDFEVGDSRFSGGKALVHNWLNAKHNTLYLENDITWVSPQYRDFAKSAAKLNGTTRLYSANVYFRIYKTSVRAMRDEYDLQHSLELFAGFSWYGERVRITEGRNLFSESIFPWARPLEPINGLDSRFSMAWQGWRVGFRERTRLSKVLALNAKFAFGPTMSYRGQGYWNLSNSGYGDVGRTRIVHRVAGQALEMSASAEWNFWKRFQLSAGYMGWFYRLQSGKQRTCYLDMGGAWTEEDITELAAARKGFFTSLSFKF